VTPIGAVVVDDEPLARASIVSLLRTDPEIQILRECSSGAEAVKVVRELRPSVLFLDVQMPGCDGFGVLEALGVDVPPAVVFVTAYDRYALKAFEAEALDYLLKPYDNARFFRVVARAKALLARRPVEPHRFERIMVRSAGRISFLRVEEIDWIEAADYYSCLHVGARTHPAAPQHGGTRARSGDRTFLPHSSIDYRESDARAGSLSRHRWGI